VKVTGAVGIVEVAGLPAAIACADAAVKAANVTLIGYELTNGGPGLVTVKLMGNVSAVQAAVDAGAAAADRVTKAHGKIVLARAHEDLEPILLNHSKGTTYTKPFRETPAAQEPEPEAGEEAAVIQPEASIDPKPSEQKPDAPIKAVPVDEKAAEHAAEKPKILAESAPLAEEITISEAAPVSQEKPNAKSEKSDKNKTPRSRKKSE